VIRRKALQLLLSIAPLCLGSRAAFGDFLQGGVTLVAGTQIHSVADTTVHNNDGTIDWTTLIFMTHRITNASSGATLRTEEPEGPGQLLNAMSHGRHPNACYRAINDSLTGFGGLSASWNSIIVCTEPACNNTPILLDLAMDGFELSAAEPSPVMFDLDADGVRSATAWTSVNADDSFLCNDRNSNGVIDDGSELFGNATPLADGERAGNGFRALAEIDSKLLRGNGDGLVNLDRRSRNQPCSGQAH
jgi:hypothetical protein